MATAKRFSYSLLFSTLAFAVFAVIAYSGLFPWIEAQFYSPKVVADLQTQLDRGQATIVSWQNRTVDRLGQLLDDPAYEGVYSPTASQDVLQKRFQSAKLFLLGLQGGATLRLLNADLSQVHFSTVEADVKARSDFSLTYRPVSDLQGLPDLKAAPRDGRAHVLSDPLQQTVYFLRPWSPSPGVEGVALLGASIEDLRLALVETGVAWATLAPVPLGAEEYLFSLLGQKLDAAVVARVTGLRTQGVLPPVLRLGVVNGTMKVALIHKGHLSLVVPESTLELNEPLKYLLLASFYTILFLVTFLLANLRGEPLSLVTRKVKRFQLQVVKQYLDLKETDRIQSLRDELARHSDEIRTDVRRSLGRVRKRDQEWVDRYIDTSWQEVMDLLRGPSPPTEPASTADWKRLETLLQQALTQGRFVVSRPTAAPLPAEGEAEAASEDVEELVEELAEEAEELVEEAEELDDVEDLEEAEEVEEAEEPEEAEELEEAEGLDDVEEVEELEEAEEAEDAQMLEPADEGESTLEELPQSGPLDFSRLRRVPSQGTGDTMTPSAEEAEVEDLEELEELEEAVEDLEEPDGEDLSYSLERLDAAWSPSSAAVFDESEDLVTLRDDVFAEAAEAQDAFGQLVGEVLAGPEGREFEPLEEDILPRQLTRDWRWTGGGFDWDRFALGEDEVNLFRALSDAVTLFDAFTAAILTEKDGVWSAQSSVGFSDAGKDVLTYPPDSPLARGFLAIRALHVLKGGLAHDTLRASFHAKDMKFLKSMFCIPLLFRHEPAWLLLGMRHEASDPLELLAPRRVE